MRGLIKLTAFVFLGTCIPGTPAKTYYVQTTTKLNWFAAYEYCESQGKQLASIHSQSEEDDVHAAIKASATPLEWMWTSGSDLGHPGTYNWMSTGEPFTYTNWGLGEPDHVGNNEHCIHLWPALVKEYTWNDFPCSTEMFFICEDKICGGR